MNFLAELAGQLLHFIFSVVGDYGLSIIIFTIITKLLLFPLTLKQIAATRKQALIQPKIKEIQQKYKDDRDKQSKALLELYQEHKINPLSGCLPLLIQLPIILGLFNALREPGVFVFPNDPELLVRATEQAFLWIPNLSIPDVLGNVLPAGLPSILYGLPGVLPIISALLTYYQMSSTPGMDSSSGANMKVFAIVMPAMFLYMGATLSAGLILYWTVSSLLQLVQQRITTNVKRENA